MTNNLVSKVLVLITILFVMLILPTSLRAGEQRNLSVSEKDGQVKDGKAHRNQDSDRWKIGTGAVNIFGDNFLSPGPLDSGSLKLFGKEANSIRPRLDIYGQYIVMPGWGKIGNERAMYFGEPMRGRLAQIAHSLEIEANLQLTGTERLHARFRPFDDWQRKPGIYRFYNRTKLPDNQSPLDLTPDTLWFEGDLGEIFDFIDPESKYPLDFNIAFGLIPIYLQDTYLMWDEILGVTISKNNIYLPAVSNLNVMLFGGFDKIDAQVHRPEVFVDDEDALLLGGAAYIDWNRYYLETTVAYLQDKGHNTVDEYHIGLSATKTIGLFGVSARTLLNIGDESKDGNGQMYILETNHPFLKNHTFYTNLFYGTEGWNPISSRNVMRRIGVSFFQCFCGLPLPLRFDGTDSSGGAMGIKFYFMNNRLYLNPEVAFLDDRSDTDNDQIAFSIEVSKKLTSHIYLMVEFKGIKNSKFSNDYGVAFPITIKF